MRSVRTVALLVLALSASAETRSYRSFRYAQGSIAAPMPGGGLAIAVSDQHGEGSLLVLDPRGNVAASRSLRSWLPAFLTTNATGEMFFGHLKGDTLQCDRVTKLRRDLSTPARRSRAWRSSTAPARLSR